MATVGIRGQIDDATPSEVRQAVLEVMRELCSATSATVMRATARKLGLNTGNHPGDKFRSQVNRALEGLAGERELRKVNRGCRLPTGGWARAYPWFYTPAAWDKAEKAEAALRAPEQAVIKRWAAVYDQLAERGLYAGLGRGRQLILGIEDWEHLLGQLRTGRTGAVTVVPAGAWIDRPDMMRFGHCPHDESALGIADGAKIPHADLAEAATPVLICERAGHIIAVYEPGSAGSYSAENMAGFVTVDVEPAGHSCDDSCAAVDDDEPS